MDIDPSIQVAKLGGLKKHENHLHQNPPICHQTDSRVFLDPGAKVITSGVGWCMPGESGGSAPPFVQALSQCFIDLAARRSLFINASLSMTTYQ